MGMEFQYWGDMTVPTVCTKQKKDTHASPKNVLILGKFSHSLGNTTINRYDNSENSLVRYRLLQFD